VRITHANNALGYAVGLAACLYLVGVASSIALQAVRDDQFFLHALDNASLIDWLKHRYATWSGRVSLDALMVVTIGIEWFWRLAIPGSLLLLALSIARLTMNEITVFNAAAALLLIALIPAGINNEAVYWVTGFYNYLLPVSLAAYTFSVMSDKEAPNVEKLIAGLFVFIFSYHEQVFAVFFVAAAISLLFDFRRFKLVVLLVATLNAAVLFMAPGNHVRSVDETWAWYPQFQEYGLLEKVFLGFDKLYQLLVMKNHWPLLLFLSLLAYLSTTKPSRSASELVSIFFVLSFIIVLGMNYLPFFGEAIMRTTYPGVLAAEWVPRARTYVGYLYTLLVMCSALTLLIGLSDRAKHAKPVVIVTLLAVASVVMMGFSPTVYASGLRVDFVFEILIIIAAFYLVSAAFHDGESIRSSAYPLHK